MHQRMTRTLPEVATAALSHWNTVSTPVLSALRSLPSPTKEAVLDSFNEDSTSALFYTFPALNSLTVGDDPEHPWGLSADAQPMAAPFLRGEGVTENQMQKHRIVVEFLCPGLAHETAYQSFLENPREYFQGHGWTYVTDTPNGSIYRHPRFHGNDIIMNGKSGQWEHLARGTRVATGLSFDAFRQYAAPRFQMRMESVAEPEPHEVAASHGYKRGARGFTHPSGSRITFHSKGWSLRHANGKTERGSAAYDLHAQLSKLHPRSKGESEGEDVDEAKNEANHDLYGMHQLAQQHGFKPTGTNTSGSITKYTNGTGRQLNIHDNGNFAHMHGDDMKSGSGATSLVKVLAHHAGNGESVDEAMHNPKEVHPEDKMHRKASSFGWQHRSQGSHEFSSRFKHPSKGMGELRIYNHDRWAHDNGDEDFGAGQGLKYLHAHLSKFHSKMESVDEKVLPNEDMIHTLSRHGYQYDKHSKSAMVYRRSDNEGSHRVHVFHAGSSGWLYGSNKSAIKHGYGADKLHAHLMSVHGKMMKEENEDDSNEPSTTQVQAGIEFQMGKGGGPGTLPVAPPHPWHGGDGTQVDGEEDQEGGGTDGADENEGTDENGNCRMHGRKDCKCLREDWQFTRPIEYKPAQTDLYRGTVTPPRPGLENVQAAYGSVLSQLMVLISTVPSQSEAATIKRLYTELSAVHNAIGLVRSTLPASQQDEGLESYISILASVRAAVGDGDDVTPYRPPLHGEALQEGNPHSDMYKMHDVAKKHGYVHMPGESKPWANTYRHPSDPITHNLGIRSLSGGGSWTHEAGGYGQSSRTLDTYLSKLHGKGKRKKKKNEGSEDVTELMDTTREYQGWTPIDNTDRPEGAKVLGVDTTPLYRPILTGWSATEDLSKCVQAREGGFAGISPFTGRNLTGVQPTHERALELLQRIVAIRSKAEARRSLRPAQPEGGEVTEDGLFEKGKIYGAYHFGYHNHDPLGDRERGVAVHKHALGHTISYPLPADNNGPWTHKQANGKVTKGRGLGAQSKHLMMLHGIPESQVDETREQAGNHKVLTKHGWIEKTGGGGKHESSVPLPPPGFSGTLAKLVRKGMTESKAVETTWAMYKRGYKSHDTPPSFTRTNNVLQCSACTFRTRSTPLAEKHGREHAGYTEFMVERDYDFLKSFDHVMESLGVIPFTSLSSLSLPEESVTALITHEYLPLGVTRPQGEDRGVRHHYFKHVERPKDYLQVETHKVENEADGQGVYSLLRWTHFADGFASSTTGKTMDELNRHLSSLHTHEAGLPPLLGKQKAGKIKQPKNTMWQGGGKNPLFTLLAQLHGGVGPYQLEAGEDERDHPVLPRLEVVIAEGKVPCSVCRSMIVPGAAKCEGCGTGAAKRLAVSKMGTRVLRAFPSSPAQQSLKKQYTAMIAKELTRNKHEQAHLGNERTENGPLKASGSPSEAFPAPNPANPPPPVQERPIGEMSPYRFTNHTEILSHHGFKSVGARHMQSTIYRHTDNPKHFVLVHAQTGVWTHIGDRQRESGSKLAHLDHFLAHRYGTDKFTAKSENKEEGSDVTEGDRRDTYS